MVFLHTSVVKSSALLATVALGIVNLAFRFVQALDEITHSLLLGALVLRVLRPHTVTVRLSRGSDRDYHGDDHERADR
jgi:hypothetical protein